MWRWGVVPREWRPSHHISSHHFDQQPVLAYLPGALAVILVFSYNFRRHQQQQQQQQQEPERQQQQQ